VAVGVALPAGFLLRKGKMKGTANEVATAATLIIFDSNTATGACGLFVKNKMLYCKPLRDRQPKDRLVRHFTKKDQEDGFSSSTWKHLKSQIVRLQKDGLL